jgi:hypothetical protein
MFVFGVCTDDGRMNGMGIVGKLGGKLVVNSSHTPHCTKVLPSPVCLAH